MSDNAPDKASVPHGLELRLVTLLAGVKSGLPKGKTLKLGPVELDSTALAHKLGELVAVHTDVREARAALQAKRLARKAHKAEALKLVAEVSAWLRVDLGADNPELVKYGLKPKKARRPRSSAEQLLQSERARETRLLRGTLGSRQRQEIQAPEPTSVTVGPDGRVEHPPVSPSGSPAGNGDGGSAPAA